MPDQLLIVGDGPADGAVAELWQDDGVWYAEIRIPGPEPKPHVIRDATIVGPLVLDPHYTPPWPGAGITKVSDPDA